MRKPKKQKKPLNDLNRSLTPFDPNETLIGVVELSKGSWLVAGIIPGVERQPLKKRFLQFQKDSTLAKWFEARTKNARTSRKKMIVALARKLLIALWHLVRDGVVPEGVVLRPAH
jgi:hypothetical protein